MSVFLKCPPSKQKRLAGELCQRLRETVTEIQSGSVAAFAEIVKGVPGHVSLVNRERFDDPRGPSEERVAVALGIWRGLALNDHGKLPAPIRHRSASWMMRA